MKLHSTILNYGLGLESATIPSGAYYCFLHHYCVIYGDGNIFESFSFFFLALMGCAELSKPIKKEKYGHSLAR